MVPALAEAIKDDTIMISEFSFKRESESRDSCRYVCASALASVLILTGIKQASSAKISHRLSLLMLLF